MSFHKLLQQLAGLDSQNIVQCARSQHHSILDSASQHDTQQHDLAKPECIAWQDCKTRHHLSIIAIAASVPGLVFQEWKEGNIHYTDHQS